MSVFYSCIQFKCAIFTLNDIRLNVEDVALKIVMRTLLIGVYLKSIIFHNIAVSFLNLLLKIS